MSMKKLTDHVIAYSNNNNSGISNLKLQKVLYFVIGNYIRDHGIDEFIKSVYTEKFEAWQYGPVLRSEYFINRKYGRYKIRRSGKIEPSYTEKFDSYINESSSKTVSDLIEESHSHEKWFSNRQRILNNVPIEYELTDLENDFNSSEVSNNAFTR